MSAGVESFYAGRPVLVTGGAGFIGSHLAARLGQAGAIVRVIDDLSTGRRGNVPGGADLVVASVLDEAALRAAMAGCEIVFHEAAMVSVPLSVEDPERCVEVNLTGTLRVLEAARAAGARRVVFASSSAVYGDEPRLPSRESDPIDPRSPYAASKAAGEALVAAWARCYGLSTVSLRYFNVYGPRQDPRSSYAAAIAAFLDAFAAGRRPVVFGDGLQTRDFVFVDDVVLANLLAGASVHPFAGEAINIASGARTSLLDVLRILERVCGAEIEPEHAPPRPGDVRHSGADLERAALLGDAPRVDLATGLARTRDSLQESR